MRLMRSPSCLCVSPNLFVFYVIRVVSKEISSSQSFLFMLSSVQQKRNLY
jgi:hypothetical protein